MSSLSSAELSANDSRRTNNFIFLIPLIRKGWLFKRQLNSAKLLFNLYFGKCGAEQVQGPFGCVSSCNYAFGLSSPQQCFR